MPAPRDAVGEGKGSMAGTEFLELVFSKEISLGS